MTAGVIVTSQIIRPQGPPIEVDWQLVVSDGRYKIRREYDTHPALRVCGDRSAQWRTSGGSPRDDALGDLGRRHPL